MSLRHYETERNFDDGEQTIFPAEKLAWLALNKAPSQRIIVSYSLYTPKRLHKTSKKNCLPVRGLMIRAETRVSFY